MKKTTKKFILTNIFTIAGLFIFALPAFAATTASFAPTDLNIRPGQKFSVAISVNPQGTANFAEKIEVKFPTDLLEVDAFTLGSNWIAMTQSGYDTVDNTNGILVKTAGYPTGITTATNFGTIKFLAKKAGNGVIKIGNNSLAFQASSQNPITGNEAMFTITAPATIVKKTETNVVTGQVATTEPTITEVEPIDEVIGEPVVQVAAVTAAVPVEASSTWIWIVGVIILAAIIYSAVVISKKKKTGL